MTEYRPLALRMLGLIALATCFAGCGGRFEAKLNGKVTLDGEPLPTGNVTFRPTEVGGSAAYARIDESGYYAVQTGRDYGLPAGTYNVTVMAREKPAVQYGKDGAPPPSGKQITPDWYHSANTSGLTVDVKPGSNRYDIELTSTPPEGWQAQQANRRGRRS